MYLIKNIFPRRAPRDFVLSLQFFSLFSNGAASRFLWLASYGQTEGCVKLFGKYALCALISSTHSRRCRHCSYQTTKKSTERILPNHHKYVYIRSRLCLCLGTYMFTLDTDSLKTLGFNPRTPTLRLRPMTSRLLKYRRCSLLLPSALYFRSCRRCRLSFSRTVQGSHVHHRATFSLFRRHLVTQESGAIEDKTEFVTGRRAVTAAHTHMQRNNQHCFTTVCWYINTRRETQFRAEGIRFFK